MNGNGGIYTVKTTAKKIFGYIWGFIRKNTVLSVAVVAAVITSFIVVPDEKYIGYFDFKTLACLFCTLAVVGALRNIHFFSYIARKIVKLTGNLRTAVTAIVCITFIGSMLIANDMALITFLPLGCFVLNFTGERKYMAFTFIMQNIAANLGGMLTPFGNPQNLYLYEKFGIGNAEFVSIMFPSFAVAVTLIIICCLFVKKEKFAGLDFSDEKPPVKKAVFYLVLFALAVLLVFRIVNYIIGVVIVVASLLFVDRKALKEVDYPLLLTFVCFFIFAGNMARIDIVNSFLSSVLQKNTLLVSILSCQFISNVPSAVLLSQFTQNYKALLIGVNIGGTGTLIASLASLITFSRYRQDCPGNTLKYLGLFSALNFGFLAVLTVFNILCGI